MSPAPSFLVSKNKHLKRNENKLEFMLRAASKSFKKIFGNTEAAVHGCYGANSPENTRDGILLQ